MRRMDMAKLPHFKLARALGRALLSDAFKNFGREIVDNLSRSARRGKDLETSAFSSRRRVQVGNAGVAMEAPFRLGRATRAGMSSLSRLVRDRKNVARRMERVNVYGEPSAVSAPIWVPRR